MRNTKRGEICLKKKTKTKRRCPTLIFLILHLQCKENEIKKKTLLW